MLGKVCHVKHCSEISTDSFFKFLLFYDDDWGMVPIKLLSLARKRSETHEKKKHLLKLSLVIFLSQEEGE